MYPFCLLSYKICWFDLPCPNWRKIARYSNKLQNEEAKMSKTSYLMTDKPLLPVKTKNGIWKSTTMGLGNHSRSYNRRQAHLQMANNKGTCTRVWGEAQKNRERKRLGRFAAHIMIRTFAQEAKWGKGTSSYFIMCESHIVNGDWKVTWPLLTDISPF